MAITYPIQDNNRFTVYDTNTSLPLRDGRGRPMQNMQWGSADKSQMISGLADHIKWLIEVSESMPSYDSATQKINRLPISYDVVNETATVKGYEIVDLTQAEIDAKVPAHYETVGGIKLDVSEQAQNAFTRMMTLVQQAQMTLETEVSVRDVFGVSHPITVETFNAEMLNYGFHCYTLFNAAPESDPTFI